MTLLTAATFAHAQDAGWYVLVMSAPILIALAIVTRRQRDGER